MQDISYPDADRHTHCSDYADADVQPHQHTYLHPYPHAHPHTDEHADVYADAHGDEYVYPDSHAYSDADAHADVRRTDLCDHFHGKERCADRE